jgi:hypothetical protein
MKRFNHSFHVKNLKSKDLIVMKKLFNSFLQKGRCPKVITPATICLQLKWQSWQTFWHPS